MSDQSSEGDDFHVSSEEENLVVLPPPAMFRDPAPTPPPALPPTLPPKEISLDRAMFSSLDGATGGTNGHANGVVEKKKTKYGSVQEKRNKACENGKSTLEYGILIIFPIW